MKKVIISIILIILSIIILKPNVYGYSLYAIKQYVNFTEIENGEEPEGYDLYISGSQLILNEQIPYISTSIDDMLYGEDGLISIDFFEVGHTSGDSGTEFDSNGGAWSKIAKLVRNLFKVTLYIAAAALLTLLIYIAILMVISGLGEKTQDGITRMFPSKKNVFKELKNKKLILEWGKSVVMIGLCVFAMNMCVSFCNMIEDSLDNYFIENKKNESTSTDSSSDSTADTTTVEADGALEGDTSTESEDSVNVGNQDIIVYVQNSHIALDAEGNMSSGDGTLHWPVDTGTISSRFGPRWGGTHKGIDIAVSEGTEVHAALDGEVTIARYSSTAGYWVVIDHGNGLVTKYMHNREGGLVVSAGDQVKKGQLIAYSGNTGDSTGPHCHFQIELNGEAVDPESYQYENAPSDLSSSGTAVADTSYSSSSSKKSETHNYTFETNLEGMLMFCSQYSWKNYAASNGIYMLSAFILVLFKYFLLGLLLARMFIVAAISVIMPMVILIDAFMKVSGNQGILEKFVFIYLYSVLLKPVIGIIYYVFVKTNIYLIFVHPMYVVLAVVLMTIGIILSIKWVYKNRVRSGSKGKVGEMQRGKSNANTSTNAKEMANANTSERANANINANAKSYEYEPEKKVKISMSSHGELTNEVTEVVKNIAGVSQEEAESMVYNPSKTIKDDLRPIEAKEIKKQLEQLGAKVNIEIDDKHN